MHLNPFSIAAPALNSDAVQDKIVDRLAYWDQVQDFFKSRSGGWNPISLNRYRSRPLPPNFAGEKIAIVHATGLIVSGRFGNDRGRRVHHGRRFGGR